MTMLPSDNSFRVAQLCLSRKSENAIDTCCLDALPSHIHGVISLHIFILVRLCE